MPERGEDRRPRGEHVSAINIHHSCCCASYKWKIGKKLADRSIWLKDFCSSHRSIPLQHDNVTLDRAFTSLDLARMMCFLQYDHYPLYHHEDIRIGGPSLKQWLNSALVTRTKVACREAKDPFDPGHLHLRMLRVADYYRITALTKHCVGMLEYYAKKHPGFAWELDGFRKKYPACAGNQDLKIINRKGFAENAKRFVKEERFKMVVKNDPGFAWAVMTLMAQKMK